MAQLRDAHTSALIAEGTPVELVTIADELGLNAGIVGIDETADELGLDVIYDDVGLGFDPDAVRQARDENIAGLKAASTTRATPDAGLREGIVAAHQAAVDELARARGRAGDVQAELEAARAAAPASSPASS